MAADPSAADASAAQMPAAEGQQEPATRATVGTRMPPTGAFAKEFAVPVPYMGANSAQFSVVNCIARVNSVLRDVQEIRSCLRLSARHAFGALEEGEASGWGAARPTVPITMKRASTDQRPGEPSDDGGDKPSAKSAKTAAMTNKDEAVAELADSWQIDTSWQQGCNHGWEKGYVEGIKEAENQNYYENKDRTNEAWEKGYNTGWEDGNASGRDKFWDQGNSSGYKNGWNEGNEVGFAKGSAMSSEKAFGGWLENWNDGWGDGYKQAQAEAKDDFEAGGDKGFRKGYDKCLADFHIEGWSPQQLWRLIPNQLAPPGNGGNGKGASDEAETLVAAEHAEDEHAVVEPEAADAVVEHEAGVTADDDL